MANKFPSFDEHINDTVVSRMLKDGHVTRLFIKLILVLGVFPKSDDAKAYSEVVELHRGIGLWVYAALEKQTSLTMHNIFLMGEDAKIDIGILSMSDVRIFVYYFVVRFFYWQSVTHSQSQYELNRSTPFILCECLNLKEDQWGDYISDCRSEFMNFKMAYEQKKKIKEL